MSFSFSQCHKRLNSIKIHFYESMSCHFVLLIISNTVNYIILIVLWTTDLSSHLYHLYNLLFMQQNFQDVKKNRKVFKCSICQLIPRYWNGNDARFQTSYFSCLILVRYLELLSQKIPLKPLLLSHKKATRCSMEEPCQSSKASLYSLEQSKTTNHTTENRHH